MGYTHYWYFKNHVGSNLDKIAEAVKRMRELYEEAGFKLCGPDGTGEPIITSEEIAFNGDRNCRHPKMEHGIQWPERDAMGIAPYWEDAAQGEWFAGSTLKSRQCNGDCSHESFWIPRRFEDGYLVDGKYFGACKTAFKPYDIIVCATLVVIKILMRDSVDIHTDGEREQWLDAIPLATYAGYEVSNIKIENGIVGIVNPSM